MYKKNLYEMIGSYRYQLAICSCSFDHYEAMKYYIVIHRNDVFENDRLFGFMDGYFIQFEGHHDFLSMDEFTQYFAIVDTCDGNKKIISLLKWLRENRKIYITIIPDILGDGYWFSYRYYATCPFHVGNIEERGFENFELAAKNAIVKAKDYYIAAHGKDGVCTLLGNILSKKVK